MAGVAWFFTTGALQATASSALPATSASARFLSSTVYALEVDAATGAVTVELGIPNAVDVGSIAVALALLGTQAGGCENGGSFRSLLTGEVAIVKPAASKSAKNGSDSAAKLSLAAVLVAAAAVTVAVATIEGAFAVCVSSSPKYIFFLMLANAAVGANAVFNLDTMPRVGARSAVKLEAPLSQQSRSVDSNVVNTHEV